GAALGCSASRARHIVGRAIQRTVSDSVEELRRVEGMQLDRLHRALWPLAIGADGQPPNLRAVSEIVRLMERRARLFGLDAPKPTCCGHEVITVEQLDAEIARLE